VGFVVRDQPLHQRGSALTEFNPKPFAHGTGPHMAQARTWHWPACDTGPHMALARTCGTGPHAARKEQGRPTRGHSAQGWRRRAATGPCCAAAPDGFGLRLCACLVWLAAAIGVRDDGRLSELLPNRRDARRHGAQLAMSALPPARVPPLRCSDDV
jgi:hypothetical protein